MVSEITPRVVEDVQADENELQRTLYRWVAIQHEDRQYSGMIGGRRESSITTNAT